MDIPHYATESDVYYECGITKETVKRVTGMEDKEITDMINSFLKTAEAKVKDLVGIPHTVPRELHVGTGEDDEFDLGPEDEEFYIEELPENCVDKVLHCYFGRERMKRPYPINSDLTEDASNWDVNSDYIQPTNESMIKIAGDYSMKFIFASPKLKARYPNVSEDNYISKNIDIFNFMFFKVQSNTANVKITVRLYAVSGGIETATFTISLKGKWYKVMLHLDDDFTGTIDWDDDELSYFEIEVDKNCTIYLDNLNFNDEWCFTAPSGKLLIMHKSVDEPPADGECFYVTYTYDPFTEVVPENIKSACAQFAAVKLIDHLIGVRESLTAFEFEADTIAAIPDKEILYNTRGTLLARAKENLSAYGFGWIGTVAR